MAKNPNIDLDKEIDDLINKKRKKGRKGKKKHDDLDAVAELFAAGKSNVKSPKDEVISSARLL